MNFLEKDFRNIPDELKIFLSLETNSSKSSQDNFQKVI